MAKKGESSSAKGKKLSSMAETEESSSAKGKEPSSMAETGKSSSAKGKEPSSMAETGESSSSAKGKEPSSMAETGESSSTKGKESSSMAETGEPSAAAREVRELKKELQRVVTMILEDEDDNGIDILSESIRILSRLREMKLNRSAIIGMDTKIKSVLNELINISTLSSPPLIMGDPFVSVSTEALDWMKSNEAELKSQEMMEKSRDLVNMLLHKLYCSFSDAKEAAKEL
ncbi:processed variable antigen [Gossypium hirsutum]|uniref:Processed variable antigen n=1 Tax=Gossypium hirsutum TaxID=3635 RepID=A0A1U8LMT9_GOSHI|nr:processed variable antigen-like [Gossypium hirsutum]